MSHDWKNKLSTALQRPVDDALLHLATLLNAIETGTLPLNEAAAKLDSDPLLRPVRDLVSLRDADVTGNVTFRDVAGGHVINITINVPPPTPPPPLPDPLAAALQQLATLPLDRVPEPADLPLGSRMPLDHNRLFVGRATNMRVLAAALHAGGTAAIGQIAIATGLGGIGKTQLASEFVYRYGQYFAGGVFWLNFSDMASVPLEVVECGLAGALHLPSSFKDLPLTDQVRLVTEAWQSPFPRLLVFDNCEDEDLLLHWRPRRGGTRVLVTGRRATWDPTIGVTPLPLGVLDRAESIDLLRKFGLTQPSDDELDLIAAELGDLPLALYLAGSYLARYRTAASPSDYLAQLRSPDLFKHTSMQGEHIQADRSPTGHLLHVARTFALSYDKLDPTEAIDALACSILLRMAYFAAGIAVPRVLLRATISATISPFDIDDALGRLIELGLLDTTANDSLSLHRLLARFVHEVIIDEVAQPAVEQALAERAKQLNHAGVPNALRALQPHLRHVTDTALTRQDTRAADLCQELTNSLRILGDYASAFAYVEHSLTIRQRVLPPNHADTARSMNDMGVMLQIEGDLVGACPYYEQALAIRLEVLGERHPDTALSLNNLGNLLQAQGDLVGARPYYEQALTIYRAVLGERHPDTARSLGNLGSLLQAQGDLVGARPYYEQALTIYRAVLGERHPDTARSLGNLGSLLQDQGELTGARPYYEQALEINRTVLGERHPDTALSLNNLGALLQAQGELTGARPYYEQALTIQHVVLGERHPDTATSLNNLGSLLRAQGSLDQARSYYEQALAINREVLGERHPNTAQSLNNLGYLLHAQGSLDQARSYYEQALAINREVLGERHLNTAQSLNNLGYLLQDQGDLKKARRCLEQALAINREVLGERHPTTLMSLSNLAGFYASQRKWGEALPLFEQALDTAIAVFGPDHLDTKSIRENLTKVEKQLYLFSRRKPS